GVRPAQRRPPGPGPEQHELARGAAEGRVVAARGDLLRDRRGGRTHRQPDRAQPACEEPIHGDLPHGAKLTMVNRPTFDFPSGVSMWKKYTPDATNWLLRFRKFHVVSPPPVGSSTGSTATRMPLTE